MDDNGKCNSFVNNIINSFPNIPVTELSNVENILVLVVVPVTFRFAFVLSENLMFG